MILLKLKDKRMFVHLVIGGVLLLFILMYCEANCRQNILKQMTDGMVDASLVDYYYQEIKDVEILTGNEMRIYQYKFDLNDDNQEDRIVCIQSPLHSGSHGDTVQILINENGEYREVLHDIYRLFMQDSSHEVLGEINILPSKQDGFRDIQIITDNTKLILQYDSGRYHSN